MVLSKIDRFRGCLQGLAIGDALGTTLEFAPPGTFEPITDMNGGGPFGLEPGEWTDDTSMALCLAESLIEKNGFDPEDQIRRYVKWWREGYMSHSGVCFDIGITTRKALIKFEATGNPFSGLSDQYSAGNGSIMRLAPIPMFFCNFPDIAIVNSGNSSKTTHSVSSAIDACRYFGALINGALNHVPKDELLSNMYCPIQDYWKHNPLCPEIEEVAMGSFKNRYPPDIKGSGYVVKSLEAALWAFYNGNTFEEGCLLAVNLGDDADTTGAVFAQLAGAHYGESAIPVKWLKTIAMRATISSLANKLFDCSENLKLKSHHLC